MSSPSSLPGSPSSPSGSPHRRLLALLGALLLPVALLTGLAATPAHAASGLTASFSSQDNGSWWKGTYVIRNTTSSPSPAGPWSSTSRPGSPSAATTTATPPSAAVM